MGIINEKIVETRKEHKCWGCGELFEKGSHLRYQTDVDGGQMGNSYWCKVCDITVQEEYEEQVDCGIGFGDVITYDSWAQNCSQNDRTYKAEYEEKMKAKGDGEMGFTKEQTDQFNAIAENTISELMTMGHSREGAVQIMISWIQGANKKQKVEENQL